MLKKRKRDEDWAAKKAAAAAEAKQTAAAKRKEVFKRAEQYVKEYRTQVGMQRRMLPLPGLQACPRGRYFSQTTAGEHGAAKSSSAGALNGGGDARAGAPLFALRCII